MKRKAASSQARRARLTGSDPSTRQPFIPSPEFIEGSKEERLLNLPLLARSYLFLGPIEAAAAVGAGMWYLSDGGWKWGTALPTGSLLYRQATTICFAGIVLCQVANVFACRTRWTSSFSVGLFTNRLLLWGVAVELCILGLIVYHPVGHRIFGTAPFDGRFWWPLLVFAALLLLADEARKGLARRHGMDRNLRYQEGTA